MIFLKSGLSFEADEIARQKGDEIRSWLFPLKFVTWKPKVHLFVPCYFRQTANIWRFSQDGLYFLQIMKWGVLQYCVIRPTLGNSFYLIIFCFSNSYFFFQYDLGGRHLELCGLVLRKFLGSEMGTYLCWCFVFSNIIIIFIFIPRSRLSSHCRSPSQCIVYSRSIFRFPRILPPTSPY